jgi:hypothetical protein
MEAAQSHIELESMSAQGDFFFYCPCFREFVNSRRYSRAHPQSPHQALAPYRAIQSKRDSVEATGEAPNLGVARKLKLLGS